MNENRRVLVTGGAGYIGSHTCKQLAVEGFEPIVYDNLSNGHRHNVKWGPLIVGDIGDHEKLHKTFSDYRPQAVIHFAALAYVGESVTSPAEYYRNNVAGSLTLLSEMRRAEVKTIVFSSTCATYGIPLKNPITEDADQAPINPYGASKLMVERMLRDYNNAYGLSFAALRYFNACGADVDGELAEEHQPETHLIPRCLQAAAGLIKEVEIFGDDYETADGTCVRDYIHVNDLAVGHVSMLQYLWKNPQGLTLNLGTGRGYSVREILGGIRSVIGRDVPARIRPRRLGDPAILLADPERSRRIIDFSPRHSDLTTIIRTAWRRYDENTRRAEAN